MPRLINFLLKDPETAGMILNQKASNPKASFFIIDPWGVRVRVRVRVSGIFDRLVLSSVLSRTAGRLEVSGDLAVGLVGSTRRVSPYNEGIISRCEPAKL